MNDQTKMWATVAYRALKLLGKTLEVIQERHLEGQVGEDFARELTQEMTSIKSEVEAYAVARAASDTTKN